MLLEADRPRAADARGGGLAEVATPALLIDRDVTRRNIARMRSTVVRGGATLRPHLKTAKSVAAAREIFDGGTGPVTVSTLREAEVFGAAGFSDILYAVGLSPDKIDRALAIRRSGIDLKVITDQVETARAIAARPERLPTMVEIDVDGERAGVGHDDPETLVAVGRALSDRLYGVMTHAGGSYGCSDPQALGNFAAREAERTVAAARLLRADGAGSIVVSIGSTPTALGAADLSGVDEVRAGVYLFFDLVMAGVGVCDTSDIALSVLTTVTGVYPGRKRLIVDAGWMAMSADRGTSRQAVDQGYGLVCDLGGHPLDNLVMVAANQEHGIVAPRPGSAGGLAGVRVGDRLRILPNHACATAAQHARYLVVAGSPPAIIGEWERFGGW